MSEPIERLLDGELEPGIYRLDMSLRPGAICHTVKNNGRQCFYLDGSKIVDKESLLAESAAAMSFPDYFGHNWDAFEECITELTWIEDAGCVILYDHAAVLVAQHPDVWATFYDILCSAIEYWSGKSRPFFVLLRNTGNTPQQVSAL